MRSADGGGEPGPGAAVRRVRDYARAFRVFHRDSTAAELSYPGNLAAGALLSLFWLVWATAGLHLFFGHVTALNGWNFDESVLVLAMFFTLNGIRQALFQPNLKRMTEYIQQGALDLFLLKPMSTQFLVSFRYVNAISWIDCAWGLCLGAFALIRVGRVPSVQGATQFLLLTVSAVVLMYCLSFAVQTLALWTVESTGLDNLVRAFFEITRFPTPFYGEAVRKLFQTVVPIAFLTTVPSEALLGRQQWRTVLISWILALAALAATRTLWATALRRYQGVSS